MCRVSPQITPLSVGAPPRSEEPGKRGNDHRAPGILDLESQRFDVGRGLSEPQLVPKPLHERTGDRHRPLEGIVHALRIAVGDRGEQTGLRRNDLLAGVHQQEGARAVGALRFARTAPQLTQQRRLLVADHPGDGHRASERPVSGSPSPGFRVRGGSDLGKHPARNGECFEQLLAPAELPEVHHEGPAGVGGVRPVHGSSGQLPHQPGLHRAEYGASRAGPVPETFLVVEEPAQLRPREVGRGGEPGQLPEALGADRGVKLGGEPGGPGVLPDDRGSERFAGRGIPHDGGLALIRDPDRSDILPFEPSVPERTGDHFPGPVPDLHRVVLHPAGTRRELAVFLLRRADDRPVPGEEQAAAAGGALVDRGHHPGTRSPACRGRHGAFNRSALPGLAPVTSPSWRTKTPETSTCCTPVE